MSGKISVGAITSRAELEQAWAIRRQVFIEEQHVPEEIELDDEDRLAFHALALLNGVPVATGRMVFHGGDEVKIGRMAVRSDLRGSGIGREILLFLMREARSRGIRKAVLHAQLTAEVFYLKCGYRPIGGVFDEAGIAHRKMECEL